MLDAARDATSFVAGRQRADLNTDRMLVLSLVKSIEIIGEAARHVTHDTQHKAPDIPWPSVINMRHRLVHAYYDINLDILWQTALEDLPPLLAELERLTEDRA